ncbi:hypothetical protein BSV1_0160 [Borreliella finlandensis]|uniref:Uncharacterized protein n=1 Tax=Borreliella finlandensis TaxID=498741 RepID=A0A826HF40_9SPIR|nr:hypothetical protein BSV1_0160 [Borreliella finlandensis]
MISNFEFVNLLFKGIIAPGSVPNGILNCSSPNSFKVLVLHDIIAKSRLSIRAL